MTTLDPQNTDHNAVLQRMAAGDDERAARLHVAETLGNQAVYVASNLDDLDRADELDNRAAALRAGR